MYPDWDEDAAILEYWNGQHRDVWVPAAMGREVPCLKDGRWVLWVYNSGRQQHGSLDMATDTISGEYPQETQDV